jgi:transcriptional regulator with XRE-family HTH domain
MKSSNLSMDKRRRTFVRLLGEIQHALNAAYLEEHERHGLTKSKMAKEIGRNRSFVTRKMTGMDNMTLETLADLAYALNRPVKVSLPSRDNSGLRNNLQEPLGYREDKRNEAGEDQTMQGLLEIGETAQAA